MSRYELPAKQAGQRVVVGYDGLMRTFFATVTEDKPDIEDDNVVLWIGRKARECVRLDELITKLGPFADIPLQVRARLESDRETAPPPTPMQQQMLRIMSGGRHR